MEISNLLASAFLAAILFFTVGSMYAAACRTTLLNEDSRVAQVVLSKFRTKAELDRFNGEHDAKVASACDKVLVGFAEAFANEQRETRKGLSLPRPRAKFADFV